MDRAHNEVMMVAWQLACKETKMTENISESRSRKSHCRARSSSGALCEEPT